MALRSIPSAEAFFGILTAILSHRPYSAPVPSGSHFQIRILLLIQKAKETSRYDSEGGLATTAAANHLPKTICPHAFKQQAESYRMDLLHIILFFFI